MKLIGAIFNPFAHLDKKQMQERIKALEKTLIKDLKRYPNDKGT